MVIALPQGRKTTQTDMVPSRQANSDLEGDTTWRLTHTTTVGHAPNLNWELSPFLSARTCPKTISNWNV